MNIITVHNTPTLAPSPFRDLLPLTVLNFFKIKFNTKCVNLSLAHDIYSYQILCVDMLWPEFYRIENLKSCWRMSKILDTSLSQ